MKKVFFVALIFTLFTACDNTIEKEIKEKISILENFDTALFNGYQINIMREDIDNPNYSVYRKDGTKEYAVFSLSPQIKIEKNFSSDSINVPFVEEFKKLGCINLYYSHEFKRIDFLQNKGMLRKKEKVILFKGEIPNHQNFLLKDTGVKELNNGWKYIVASKE